MKTARKHAFKCLTIVFLTIIGLTCPLFQVRSTEEGSSDPGEQEQEIEAREAYLHMLLQDENGNVPPDAWSNAYAEKEAMSFLPGAWAEFLPPPNAQGTDPNALPWGSIGPGNIGGRMRSIIIDPRDPDTIWVGGVSGGIWKTSNGGITWSTNTDLLTNLAT